MPKIYRIAWSSSQSDCCWWGRERPASVVKELVENAIDAGSTQITIEVWKNQASQKIQITDNGEGMAQADVAMSLRRHATSKIKIKEISFVFEHLVFEVKPYPL